MPSAGVKVLTNIKVEQVVREDGFLLRAGDEEFHADVAGGCHRRSVYSQDGRDRFGYDLARQFGLKIVEPRPRAGSVHF